MNHDCSSYVMICLCIGFDQDFVTGSREQIERDALTHMGTYKIKWNTGGDIFLFF